MDIKQATSNRHQYFQYKVLSKTPEQYNPKSSPEVHFDQQRVGGFGDWRKQEITGLTPDVRSLGDPPPIA